MRAAALLAVFAAWVVAVVVVLACGFAAFLGRADWGDGQGPSMSVLDLAGLGAVALVAVAAAAWLTRRLGRLRQPSRDEQAQRRGSRLHL